MRARHFAALLLGATLSAAAIADSPYALKVARSTQFMGPEKGRSTIDASGGSFSVGYGYFVDRNVALFGGFGMGFSFDGENTEQSRLLQLGARYYFQQNPESKTLPYAIANWRQFWVEDVDTWDAFEYGLGADFVAGERSSFFFEITTYRSEGDDHDTFRTTFGFRGWF
jgi:hypothetical protein